ncbi:MAG: hypothetical protein QOG53_2189 [Frankiales bacterium]|jgi:hypothetical protein|nr:hypothetical protein [Frankiales bacterium]
MVVSAVFTRPWFGALTHVPTVLLIVALTAAVLQGDGAPVAVPFFVAYGLTLILCGRFYWDSRQRGSPDWNLFGFACLCFSLGYVYAPYYWWKYVHPTGKAE